MYFLLKAKKRMCICKPIFLYEFSFNTDQKPVFSSAIVENPTQTFTAALPSTVVR